MCKEKTKKLEREKEENEAETVRVNAEHNRVHSDFLKLDEAFRVSLFSQLLSFTSSLKTPPFHYIFF